ncbi:glycosyltransferase family 4 protein [Aerococcaceae bacterium zg-ZJ1578]|uniref:glycosyltransferase family 4 protein n=1 Tax=Aerococcaceae bacterium zg-252 TaxID=2796928 RepID=UPI001A29C6E9|nr:glycosyltransferase family 4 protein [Aerococcaceae bacterium zg-1578]
MKILFLTTGKIDNFETSGFIYTDLIRKCKEENHEVYVVHPLEKRLNRPTVFEQVDNVTFLRIRTGNITKTSFIEKGIATLKLEFQFIKYIKKYLSSVKFDLVLYSTPPITFNNVISYIKKRDHALSYLLLKDIFPQNAVDLNIFSEKSIIYKYFRGKEKKLYLNSNVIGCMSEANKKYIIKHNDFLKNSIIEINPNTIQIKPYEKVENNTVIQLKNEFNIPLDKTVFFYGGNLGKPQGIDFLLDVISKNERSDNQNYIIIVGAGTEYNRLKEYIVNNKISNTNIIDYLPKEKFDKLIKIADVGLIFLDYRFSIPNFPSRLLSYLENKLPILAATDEVSDIKEVINDGKFGLWVPSNDSDKFIKKMEYFKDSNLRKQYGDNGYRYLVENFDVNITYQAIMKHFTDKE